jgi:prepilin-type processing-associated H-X9-DG protein
VNDNHAYPLSANPNYNTGSFPNHFQSWEQALEHTLGSKHNSDPTRYLSKGLWKCPTAIEPPDWQLIWGNTNSNLRILYVSYGYNIGMSATPPDTNLFGLASLLPLSESEVINPSDMMAVGDGIVGSGNFLFGGQGCISRSPPPLPTIRPNSTDVTSRHESKANVVFCDGHVESPTLQFLFADTSDAALSRWNRDHQPHREKLSP